MSSVVHLIIDFAEKVILPSLVKQTGLLQFITGLKNDIFGCSCTNNGKVYIFNLPEGYWPGGKSAFEVISIFSVFH